MGWFSEGPPQEEGLPSPAELSAAQTQGVRQRLALDPRTFPRFGIPDLHALYGAIAPQEVIVFGAKTSGGKSLMGHNLVRWLTTQGVPVLVMGTEQSADVLRIKQACSDLGIRTKLLLKPELHEIGTPEHETATRRVLQRADELDIDSDGLQWAPAPEINRAVVRKYVQWAVEEMDAKVVIVDHIHHMSHGSGQNTAAELAETMHLIKLLAKQYDIAFIVMSQLKRDPPGMESFAPPGIEDFGGSSAIERTADGAFGLWRPLRFDLTPAELRDLLKSVREGRQATDTIFEPGVMGVKLLKDRLGEVFGRQAFLRVNHGRLETLPERDRHSTTYDGVRAI